MQKTQNSSRMKPPMYNDEEGQNKKRQNGRENTGKCVSVRSTSRFYTGASEGEITNINVKYCVVMEVPSAKHKPIPWASSLRGMAVHLVFTSGYAYVARE